MVKNPSANAGDIRDVGSIPESGKSPGGRHGNPLQYSYPPGSSFHGILQPRILEWVASKGSA